LYSHLRCAAGCADHGKARTAELSGYGNIRQFAVGYGGAISIFEERCQPLTVAGYPAVRHFTTRAFLGGHARRCPK
jgi:hypothetical protein